MTVYLHAIERHLLALWDGEDVTDDSGVPHLGSIVACAAILADAREGGFLVDDRPPQGPATRLLKKWQRPTTTIRKNRERPFEREGG